MARPTFSSKAGVAATFVVGVLSAPYVKPLLRLAVKKSVRAALRARKLAAEAAEDFQDMVAEAGAPEPVTPIDTRIGTKK